MATLRNWTGEGATTGNVTIANSNGANGDALDGPTPFVTGTALLTFGTTNPIVAATKSLRHQSSGGTGSGRARSYWRWPVGASLFQGRFACRHRLDPNAANLLWALTDTGFATPYPIQCNFVTRSGARHLVLNALGVEVADFGAWPSWGSAQADYTWFDCFAVKGNTTSTPKGQLTVKWYDWDGTEIGSYVSPLGGLNMGTANFQQLMFTGNTDVLMDMDIAWIKASQDAAALLGLPSMTVVPPTCTVPSRPIPFEPGTITIPGCRGQDTDGTIGAVHAAILSGPNSPAITATPTSGFNTNDCTYSISFDGLASSQYVVDTWVTDNALQDSTHRQITVDTLSNTTVVSVLEDLSPAGWSAYGTAPSALAALTDGDDATGRQTGFAPNHQKGRYRMAAYRLGRPMRFIHEGMRSPAGGAAIAFTARLYAADGTTLIETKTVDELGNPLLLAETVTTQAIAFAGAALTAPADRVDCQVEIDYLQ